MARLGCSCDRGIPPQGPLPAFDAAVHCNRCYLFWTVPAFNRAGGGDGVRESPMLLQLEPGSDLDECEYLGAAVPGPERQRLGLGHGGTWKYCQHPARPLGDAVCPCRGCGPACGGYSIAAVQKPAIVRRNLLFHLHPVPGAWQWHADRLRLRLPLFNGRRVIAVTSGAGLDPFDHVRESFPGCELIEVPNDPRLREVATFEPLFGSLSAAEGEATLYAQSKGVTRRPEDTARRWAEIMYEVCCDYWPVVAASLDRHSLTGPFRKLGRGWRPDESASDWHYSGSWFWFRNADLLGRPDWRRIDRFWSGIEPYPSLHFKAQEAACIFHPGAVPALNLYDWNYLARTVEPALTAWQRRHANERTTL